MEQTLSLGCLVMAAGSGRRFGGNKLAAELDGKTLIRRANLGNRQITGQHILYLRKEQQPIVALRLFF